MRTSIPRLAACTVLLGAGAWLLGRLRAESPAPREWAALLAPAPVRRLSAAIIVDARDCAGTLGTLELFARPELAGAIGSVSVLVRDGRDSLARYADARLTAGVQV